MHGVLHVVLFVVITYTFNQGLPAMQSQTTRIQEALSCAIATRAHDSLEAIRGQRPFLRQSRHLCRFSDEEPGFDKLHASSATTGCG